MSGPRPIHQPHREIRSQPDDAEPSFSYEKESYLSGGREEDVEDDFHRRVSTSRRDSGASFWRSTSSGENFGGPSFSSVSMKPSGAPLKLRTESNAGASSRGGGGRRSLSLRSQDPMEGSSASVSEMQSLVH